MAGFFSRKKKDDAHPSGKASKNKKGAQQNVVQQQPVKPKWEDAWARKSVEPEEVMELLRGCTLELKGKALDTPFLLLPFRPTSDHSAARTFIRNFFDRAQHMHGEALAQELRLTEPMVLCSVVKWCWARLPGGVVGWEAYELFKVGESDSNMARDSFATFIPLSVESDSRTQVIFDFFDLLSAIAAHGKSNGLGGRKLSRLAAWWAFEQIDTGSGFEGGYRSWEAAADATSHLFFAYLRSLAPESVKGLNGISTLPMSLQKLVQETEYPPEKPSLLQSRTLKVVMVVDSVSPTPFALLRRTNHFQYRDEDRALQEFSNYEDPVKALTEECKRVLKSISAANQSAYISTTKETTGAPEATWSRFEDIGFAGALDSDEDEDGKLGMRKPQGLRTTPASGTMDMGRPTTPSWADFLSSGFVDEAQNNPAPLLLPPDKVLPPIETDVRGRSSQSHNPRLESNMRLEPGELASISRFDLDEAFWWVWISSLAGEEPSERKAAFGRCALVETVIKGGRWLVMEEMVKGAAPEPAEGAYIAEKKGLFSWTKRNKGMTRRKSTGKYDTKKSNKPDFKMSQSVASKTSIGPDQHARIQAAAAQLQQRQKLQDATNTRRGRMDMDAASQKTNSVFTLQPVIMSEASPAMKWANKYDKDAIREAYLANSNTGRGLGQATMHTNGNGHLEPENTVHRQPSASSQRDLPKLPESESESKPAVPSKSSPSVPVPVVQTPATHDTGDHERIQVSDKAAEADYPRDPHPIERKAVAVQMPPPVTNLEHDARAPSVEPPVDFDQAHQEKHKKLQKKAAGGGGFRNMFGRKKSHAPPPSNGNITQNQPGQLQPGGATVGRRFSGFRKNASPNQADAAPQTLAASPPIQEDDLTPVQSPEQGQFRSYEHSTRDSLSRVDTNDAQEAKQEFSRFDQGPLEDQPAFAGESPELSPIHGDDTPVRDAPASFEKPATVPEIEGEDLTKTVSPAQDRWAQIRKNAAERAAQRQSEEQSRGGQSAATDGDGETSGEETIESRVARIKQRVAELTGNMETGGPSPPNGRRS